MKKIILTLLFIPIFLQDVFAEKLSGALLEAYKNNPELNAERENLKVSKEDLNISKSEFLPSVTLVGSKIQEDTEKLTDRSGTNTTITNVDPKTKSIIIEQKLFQGFAGVAGVKKIELV